MLEGVFSDGSVTHLDYSADAVSAVRARLKQHSPPHSSSAVVCGDARALHFPAASFDVVVIGFPLNVTATASDF